MPERIYELMIPGIAVGLFLILAGSFIEKAPKSIRIVSLLVCTAVIIAGAVYHTGDKSLPVQQDGEPQTESKPVEKEPDVSEQTELQLAETEEPLQDGTPSDARLEMPQIEDTVSETEDDEATQETENTEGDGILRDNEGTVHREKWNVGKMIASIGIFILKIGIIVIIILVAFYLSASVYVTYDYADSIRKSDLIAVRIIYFIIIAVVLVVELGLYMANSDATSETMFTMIYVITSLFFAFFAAFYITVIFDANKERSLLSLFKIFIILIICLFLEYQLFNGLIFDRPGSLMDFPTWLWRGFMGTYTFSG